MLRNCSRVRRCHLWYKVWLRAMGDADARGKMASLLRFPYHIALSPLHCRAEGSSALLALATLHWDAAKTGAIPRQDVLLSAMYGRPFLLFTDASSRGCDAAKPQ